jgi:hypothetical protein
MTEKNGMYKSILHNLHLTFQMFRCAEELTIIAIPFSLKVNLLLWIAIYRLLLSRLWHYIVKLFLYEGPKRKKFYEAPDPLALQAARERRLNELKMYDILREVGLYCVYVIVAMMISYDCRDPEAYLVKNNMMSFLDGGRGHAANSSTSISQVYHLYTLVS